MNAKHETKSLDLYRGADARVEGEVAVIDRCPFCGGRHALTLERVLEGRTCLPCSKDLRRDGECTNHFAKPVRLDGVAITPGAAGATPPN